MLKLISKLIALFLLAFLIVAAVFFWKINAPLPVKNTLIDVEIVPGATLRQAATEIAKAGVEFDPRLLILLAKLQGVDTSIKAGNYQIGANGSLLDLLHKLTLGDVTQTDVSFIEGKTFQEMRDIVDKHPEIRHETKGLSEEAILRLIGASQTKAEGLFFPDTYFFAKQSRDTELFARAYQLMQRHLEREWANREANLPYANPYEALIMASIIEKETGQGKDRAMVASVFVNRLRIGMRLQTDPTVIYGLGENFDGNLRRNDLINDTPHNTYTRAGLPPTPIAMPGLASLRAALHPAKSEALYFVARGDGSSQFSKTLTEHNQAVNRYLRRKKQNYN